MQTNLHRVSEFAVTTKQTAEGARVKAEERAAIKRLREHDSDTESEVDENGGGTNISTNLPALNGHGGAAPDASWQDTMKTDVAEHDNSVFLSFNWENEEPYEKAVERYHSLFYLYQITILTSENCTKQKTYLAIGLM